MAANLAYGHGLLCTSHMQLWYSNNWTFFANINDSEAKFEKNNWQYMISSLTSQYQQISMLIIPIKLDDMIQT
jgi:hypothetical protein